MYARWRGFSEIERIGPEVAEQAITMIRSSVLDDKVIALATIDGVVATVSVKSIVVEITVDEVVPGHLHFSVVTVSADIVSWPSPPAIVSLPRLP